MVVNNGYRLAPWADVLYACDYDWWAHNQGRTDFAGLRIGGDVRDGKWGVRPIKIDMRRDEILVHKFGTIGIGGNSGFQALNLAAQFGCRNIILVGYDMHDRAGIHWHGKHGGGLNNPSRTSLARWRGVIDGQAPLLERMGVRVINASPDSALTAYPKMTFSAALAACTERASVVA
ncbi:hypothetical protein EB231_34920 [Mesorhizobium sp. NZP2298]|nr:hypothetical protein EB231_34920 [Mesorhizobium sp. NZP2298]